MKKILYGVLLGLIGGALAGGLIILLVGSDNQGEFGGGTRMINGLSTDSTSPSAGQVRTTTLTTTAGAIFDTNTLVVNSTTDRIGIASTTPNAQLSVGNGTASSTVSMGKLCWYVKDQGGTGYYVYIPTGGGTTLGSVFATTTTSCF